MSKYVMVECVSTFRQRYVIEVPDSHNDGEIPCSAIQWAEDTVTMEEMKEFSQLWLGETIVSSREVDEKEILRVCDVDNDYCKSWTDEQKLKTFITPVGYKKDW